MGVGERERAIDRGTVGERENRRERENERERRESEGGRVKEGERGKRQRLPHLKLLIWKVLPYDLSDWLMFWRSAI